MWFSEMYQMVKTITVKECCKQSLQADYYATSLEMQAVTLQQFTNSNINYEGKRMKKTRK